MESNKVEKNEENIVKAANVAETSFKLRKKKKTGKLMKIDETNEALPKLDRNMTNEQIFDHLRSLCNPASYENLYKKVECCGFDKCLVSGKNFLKYFFSTILAIFRMLNTA